MNSSGEAVAGFARPKPAFLVSLLGAALPGLYLLVTSTVPLLPGILRYDQKRMLEFCLLLLLFLLPAVNAGIRKAFGEGLASVPRAVTIPLVGIFAWGAISASVHAHSALHWANSLSEVVLLATLALAVFVVAACRRLSGIWFDRVAIGLIALTVLAVGAQEFVGLIAARDSGVVYGYSLSLLHFSHPRFFNQVQSWVVPVLVALPLLFRGAALSKILGLCALALSWYIILMTAARGTAAGLTAAFLFAAIFLAPVRKTLFRGQALGLALGAMIYAIVLVGVEASSITGDFPSQPQAQTSAANKQDSEGSSPAEAESRFLKESLGRSMSSSTGRTWIWKVAAQEAIANPLLGIGPMNFACTSKYWFGHPHNFPVQIAAEWGVPVVIVLLVLTAALLLRAQQLVVSLPPVDGLLAGLLMTGLLAAGVHACFSGILVMPASQVTGMLVCGMLLSFRPLPMPRPAAKRAFGAGGVIATGMVFSACLVALGARELTTMSERAAQLPPTRIIAPRIWQDPKVCQLYLGQYGDKK